VLLGKTAEKLEQFGVRTLAVVGSDPDRVRLYLRYRPTHCTVAADPELAIHRAYGVPRAPLSAEIWGAVDSACVDLARDLRLPLGAGGAREAVERLDGFQSAESDQVDLEKHQTQFTAQFLVDRQGIVRWANIECARDGLAAIDRFPTDDEILTAARALTL
jgi:hypothetical protein